MNDWKQHGQHTTTQKGARVVHERKPLPDNELDTVLSRFVRTRVRTRYHATAAWQAHKTLQIKNLRQTKSPIWPCFVQHRCWTRRWAGEGGVGGEQ
jgi:hypothetical protein